MTIDPRPVERCDECGVIVREGWFYHDHDAFCSLYNADEDDCS